MKLTDECYVRLRLTALDSCLLVLVLILGTCVVDDVWPEKETRLGWQAANWVLCPSGSEAGDGWKMRDASTVKLLLGGSRSGMTAPVPATNWGRL